MATAEIVRTKRFRATVRDGVVAVEVGPERVRHFVHKALLEEHSEYFKRALNGSWKEAEDRVVCLDNVDCGSFEVFVDWLYTRRLPVTNEEWNEDEYRLERGAQWHTAVQVAMIKAYAFADRMLLPDLRQALEHELIDYFIVEGCSNTDENGELQLRSQLPNAFLVGVMVRQAKLNADKVTKLDECGCYDHEEYVAKLDRCDYHDHATDKEKKECRRAASTEGDSCSDCSGSDNSDSD